MKPDLLKTLITERSTLVKAAYKIVGCYFMAEDVVQDAYFKILEMQSTIEVRQPICYLRKIVRNLSIDKIRRTSVENRYKSTEDTSTNYDICEPSPEKLVADQQKLIGVFSALQELPKRTQTAFVLNRIEGSTQQSIAKQLNVSTTLVNFMVRDAHSYCYSRLQI